jgi:hypothetical protein
MQKQDLPARGCFWLVLHRDYLRVRSDCIFAADARKAPRIDLSVPEITGDCEEMRTFKEGLEITPQI